MRPLYPTHYFSRRLKEAQWLTQGHRKNLSFLISLVLALSTCLVHTISILILCKDVSTKKTIIGHRNFKAFYDLYCSLEFFGFCFLKTIKSIFKIFVCYILRLCAWHKKWYLISPCWVTWVIRELLGTRICHVGSMKSCCLKHWTNPDHYSLKTCSLKDACCALVALPRLNSHFFVTHSTSVGNRGICV